MSNSPENSAVQEAAAGLEAQDSEAPDTIAEEAATGRVDNKMLRSKNNVTAWFYPSWYCSRICSAIFRTFRSSVNWPTLSFPLFNFRYGPPRNTEYRVIVENLSSRVSWQVSSWFVYYFKHFSPSSKLVFAKSNLTLSCMSIQITSWPLNKPVKPVAGFLFWPIRYYLDAIWILSSR